MKEIKRQDNPFEDFEEFKERKEGNRQASYENKVCKKLLGKMFSNDPEQLKLWTDLINKSDSPLAELEGLTYPWRLTTHRFQSWNLEDLFLRPTKTPIWAEYAKFVDECSKMARYKGWYPAMVFYNSVGLGDLIIHSALYSSEPPAGYMRLVRRATGGEGGVVIDTLDGFIEMAKMTGA